VTGMEEGRSPETRRCILEAAQQLFAAHGYHGASIRDIVHACGVSNAALYYHFGSKQQLYFEVIGKYIATVAERLRDADPGEGTCRNRLARVALAYARTILESENLLQTLLRDAVEFDQADVARVLSDLSGQIPATIAAILEEGITAGEIRAVPTHRAGILMIGMANATSMRRLYSQVETTLEQDVDLVIDVLFEGIAVYSHGGYIA
jgi:AcrR family transcriptional regulator